MSTQVRLVFISIAHRSLCHQLCAEGTTRTARQDYMYVPCDVVHCLCTFARFLYRCFYFYVYCWSSSLQYAQTDPCY
uniref:Putative secreted protein salivary gland overexpressed n=1 Tax=Rhipicephalus microplus TaxID=6941 RepID=A0A6M2DEP5_RHIMP